MVHKVELYRDVKGGWRWRAVAKNGEVVSASESYTRKWSAKRAAKKTFPSVPIIVK